MKRRWASSVSKSRRSGGNAVANESTEITSKTVNTVTAIRFTEGQLVRRGDSLVEFDRAQACAELAAAQAALAESASQYKGSRELFSTQALSQSQLDAARCHAQVE